MPIRYLKKMPYVLIGTVLFVLFIMPFFSIKLQAVWYACSLSIKTIILFVLPFIIFGLLFRAVIELAGHASQLIILILLAVVFSNTLAAFLSHYVGQWVYHFSFLSVLPHPEKTIHPLQPYWQWHLHQPIENAWAMFTGLFAGFLGKRFFPIKVQRFALQLGRYLTYVLQGIVILIPIFVGGFVVKLHHDGQFALLFREYTEIFLIIVSAQLTYVFLAYFLLSQCHLRHFFRALANMFPAIVSGLTTMSSAVSMPLTILGVENNTKHKDVAGSVVPATVNIHLIGDCFAIPIFAYAILKTFGLALPSFTQYVVFLFYFVIAKFSVAAVPGGGILVMLPILQHYMGFHGDMLSLITALYILFDPVITATNILGNGAFALFIDKILLLKKRKTKL